MNDTDASAVGSVPVSTDWGKDYDPPIGANAQAVIEKRYSVKDAQGRPTETWGDIVHRVVSFVSQAETVDEKRAQFYDELHDLMLARKFVPNTPCLVNAGVSGGGLAGCYVLPVPDSIKGIMKAASDAATIHQGGGGTGFSFETLRPAGSLVKTTHGIASGPISFMGIFDKVTDVVKQGGVRRGANMGIMRCDHPDILRFIHAKNDQHSLTNFNISVSITDEFMEAVEKKQWIQTKFKGEDWTAPIFDPLVNGVYSSEKPGMVYAPDVWNRIVTSAHQYAEPGIIFIDTVNRHNFLRQSMGDIIATNPCAEQALHPYNSCNLGSIDVSKFYKPNWNGCCPDDPTPSANFDWDEFKNAITWAVRFLDNVIDVGDWVMPEIEDVVKRTRPVGLGIMGFADLLLKMKEKYGSPESLDFLDLLTSMFQRDAWEASCRLGAEKGEFPEYQKNKELYEAFLWDNMNLDDLLLEQYDEMERGNAGHFHPRNYEVTTIAPTGTISLVAETSSGIEPNFAWEHTRKDTVGERFYIHPIAAQALGVNENNPEYSIEQQLLGNSTLPDYFVTAHDLTAEQHLRVLAAAQRNIDNGVSKTCNAPADDTVENVDKLYRLAHKLGVKAVSYYRDGSRDGQVLTRTESRAATIAKRLGSQFLEAQHGIKLPQPVEKKQDTCPECGADLVRKEGCVSCSSCDFAVCTIG